MKTRLLVGTTALALAATASMITLTAAPAQAGVTMYPIPTQGAGPADIVTAPDGNMWFSEIGGGAYDGVNQVGRITPSGQVTEYQLPAPPGGWEADGPGDVEDLAVAPDDTVWVVYDGGWQAIHLDRNGSPLGSPVSLGAYPYGKTVRVTADGIPWITMSFDEDGLARIVNGQMVWYANAPQCENDQSGPTALGVARDGSVWCQDVQNIVHSNADASGGITCPLAGPTSIAAPTGIVAGPTGSVWLTSWEQAGFLSPNDGGIGYVDDNCNYTGIALGSRTAPTAPVLGPDGNVWFANEAAAPGIGHVSATWHGAIHSVGNFHPTSLTFAHDGSIFFTDPDANAIVRVLPADLQTTDVDLGDGSQLIPNAAPAQVMAGQVKAPHHVIRVKHARVLLKLHCQKKAAKCVGKLTLVTKKGSHAVAKKKAYTIAAGKTHKLRIKLTRKGKHRIDHRRVTKLKVKLYLKGKHKPAVVKVIKVRR